MSGIPERLWNVVQGHWGRLQERDDEADAVAEAYAELAEHIRIPKARPNAGEATRTPTHSGVGSSTGQRDPLAVSYSLLEMSPGAGIEELELKYAERLKDLDPEAHPQGSSQRHLVEERRRAVDAAYERLRDTLNPTETRFERIEF